MLFYITVIFCCQLVGELITVAFGLPLPGPVIGMILLLSGLVMHGSIPAELEQTGEFLLKNLSLLFVPAGVGVMLHFGLLEKEWLPLSISLIVSTVITIAVTAWIMQRLSKADDV